MWLPQHLRSPALDPATGGDPYRAFVVLQAGNESGADGTTTFLDQSSYARTLTAVGNAQWDTAQAPTGQTSSILLDGAGDRVTAAASSDFNVAAGNFAGDIFVRYTANTNGVLAFRDSGGSNRSYGIYRESGRLRFFYSTTGSNAVLVLDNAWVPTLDQWYWVAWSRSGDSWRYWIDGTQLGSTATAAVTVANPAGAAYSIGGATWIGGYDVNGHIASHRLTIGSDRGYTGATLSVPSLPFATS